MAKGVEAFVRYWPILAAVGLFVLGVVRVEAQVVTLTDLRREGLAIQRDRDMAQDATTAAIAASLAKAMEAQAEAAKVQAVTVVTLSALGQRVKAIEDFTHGR